MTDLLVSLHVAHSRSVALVSKLILSGGYLLELLA